MVGEALGVAGIAATVIGTAAVMLFPQVSRKIAWGTMAFGILLLGSSGGIFLIPAGDAQGPITAPNNRGIITNNQSGGQNIINNGPPPPTAAASEKSVSPSPGGYAHEIAVHINSSAPIVLVKILAESEHVKGMSFVMTGSNEIWKSGKSHQTASRSTATVNETLRSPC
jgi:hypothetical protein